MTNLFGIAPDQTHLQYQRLTIEGGVPLHGTAETDSSKNATLPLLAATLLTSDLVTLHRVPQITDIAVMGQILKGVGAVCHNEGTTVKVKGRATTGIVPKELSSQIRASIVLLGALITTLGEVELPLPGGDKIGERPVDIHLEALGELGVESYIKGGVIYAKTKELPLTGANIFLRFPSVLATANLIIAASLAKGQTVIYNAACEPEIVDVAIMLNQMGAKIFGAGTNTIKINGVESLSGAVHEPIPDRIEAGTLLTALAITGGSGVIKRCIPEHNIALISLLKKIGVQLVIGNDNSIEVKQSVLSNGIHVMAMPYPGLATDLQPLVTSLATQCRGESIISDIVHPDRFAHLTDLIKMGANLIRSGNQVRVYGGEELAGTQVEGTDIRSVTALICAGLAAKGASYVSGLEHLHRGHANLIKKLGALHARIEYI